MGPPERASRVSAEAHHTGTFVGRESELAALAAAVAEAHAGRGRLILLVGAPGIGKTRVLEELVARAKLPAERVLWGRCTDDAGAPAYWPWVQVLRAWVAARDAGALRAELGDVAGELARLVPSIRDQAAEGARAANLDPEQARFRLFDAVAVLLRRAAAGAPLVVALDDLQSADDGSLRLLGFLAREVRASRVLIVAACREAAARERTQLLELAHAAQRLPLRGLDADDVERLLRARATAALPPGFAERVHRATDGNPFFAEEMLRAYEGARASADRERASEVALPDEMRGVVERHLTPLSAEQRDLLALAATIGREFDLATLEVAADLPPDRVLDDVDAVARAGLVEEAPGRLGRLRFRHGLLREALEEGLAPAERAALHLRVARALQSLHGASDEPPYEELAVHFHAAAPLGTADAAVHYSVRAARRALSRLAYEDAVKHYERARAACALRPADAAGDVRILIGLAEAVWQTGDQARARTLYERAARGAREIGDAHLFGLAALGFSRATPDDGAVHPDVVALLEEALERLPAGDGLLRAFAVTRLVVALYFTQDRERLESLSVEGVAMARRIGVPRAVIGALISRHFVLLGPDRTPAERLPVVDEALRLARESNDVELAQPAQAWRIVALLEMGDAPAARHELATYRRRWEESRLPIAMWHARVLAATGALLDGRLAEAERLAREALAQRPLGLTSQPSQFYALLVFDVLREWGRLAELEPALRAIADEYPAVPGWRCFLAALLLDTGRASEARAALAPLAATRFAGIPRDGSFLLSVSCLAEAVSELGEPEWARDAYALLEPVADRHVVAVYGATCRGAAARELGLLAASLGRLDDAALHLEDALARNVRTGARAWAARTRADLAGVLLARGGAPDLARARQLAAEARRAARELAMPRLSAAAGVLAEELAAAAARAEAPRPSSRTAARGGPTAAGDPAAVAVLRRDGASWTVGWLGEPFRLADMKGLAHLARLVAEPGREFAALELVEAEPGGGDPGAAAERARVNATRAISAAVKRIAKLSPGLGRHLSRAVRTGLACSYRPDPDRPVAWRL